MAARVVFPLLVAALAWASFAQVVVEDDDEIVTQVVDIFNVHVDNTRSINAAMAMSLAAPGTGHYYIDKPKSAFIYMAVDAASIFGALMFYSFASQRENEARSYAAAAAKIEQAPSGEAYWRNIGAFMDAASYNEAVELSRGGAGDLYLSPESWWRWGDESQQQEYNDMRQKARDLRVVSSFFVGALVVNRLISVIDIRVFGKRRQSSTIRMEPALAPDLNGAAVVVRTNF